MSGMISQSTIDEVSSRTDIVSVIQEYVPLTQKGNDWWGCCPFHNEKTPSFSVSVDKKFYYCFGCHAGGTVFNFIMQMEKLTYPEAIEFLAKRAGVPIQYTDGGEAPKEDPNAHLKNEYIDLYNRVAGTFHYLLMETEAGKFALDYITKRGLTKETLEKFKLGYSPADRKWLKQFLLKKNYSEQFLDGSGLFSKKYPDFAFFSDRLMFPIFDRKGDVVAMGGRFLRGDPEKSPKYLNSGDLIQYKKGTMLYAFNFAKQAIRENHKVIFCEGYMDCIAYHQCGITYAVAPLGTALTEDQIHLVKPFVDAILLSFDSDAPGQAATKRAILMCRKHDVTVKVIQLSGGKDPAEIMVNFGAPTLTNDVNNAILDNDFLLSGLLAQYPKDTPEGKAKASLEYFQYIDALQSDVQKDACLDQFCQTFSIDPEAARKDFNNREQVLSRFSKKDSAVKNTTAELPKYKPTAELRAVVTAVADTDAFFLKMRNEFSVDDLTDPQAKNLFIILEECWRSGTFSTSNILNRIEDKALQQFVFDSTKEYSNHAEESFYDSMKLVKRNVLNRRRAELQGRINTFSRSGSPEDKAQIPALVAQIMDIDKQISL